jgi:hypothetical protein
MLVPGGAPMNDKQVQLIGTVMDMISHQADLLEEDTFYATPAWLFENWWHTLNAVLKLTDTESS